MSKTIKRQYIFGILISGLLLSCDDNNYLYDEKSNHYLDSDFHERHLLKLEPSDIPEVKSFIVNNMNGYLPGDEAKLISQGRSQNTTNPFGIVGQEEIFALEDLEGNRSYTFKIVPFESPTNYIYNLIVVTDISGAILKSYIKEYEKSEITTVKYDGKVKDYNLDGTVMNEFYFIDGRASSNECFDCTEDESNDDQSDEENDYDDTVDGPEDSTENNGTSSSGGTGGSGTGTSGGGSSGGGVDVGISDTAGEDIFWQWICGCVGHTDPSDCSDPQCIASGTLIINYPQGRFQDDNLGLIGCCGDDVVIIEDGEEEIEEDCDTSKEALMMLFPLAAEADMELLAEIINLAGAEFGIDSEEKLQHFLAQAGHESDNFQSLSISENLNYSANRLIAVWPRRFSYSDPTKLNPNDYSSNPSALADIIYANRMGNGSVESGDGYLFRGRGIFQLTGRANYQAYADFLENNNLSFTYTSPDDLLNPLHAIISAMWFYQKNVLSDIIVNENTEVDQITKEINRYTDLGSKIARRAQFTNAQETIDCL